MIDYRSAVGLDTLEIVDVLRAVWPDDAAQVDRIASAIARPQQHAIVSIDGARVVGFVEGFPTVSATGARRLEVDLLAVHPDWQKRGIGRELVRLLTNRGTGRDFARGLVRIGNVGSERAFAACGYEVEPRTLVLYSSPTRGHGPSLRVDGLHVIPVETFTYSGLWLEGQRTNDNLRLAPLLLPIGHDVVGAVIPVDEVAALDPESAGYHQVGEYRWWRHDYNGRC